MKKLGPIWFADELLDALRDDKLVVFAGAGVSMGPPSSLASFLTLAERIASGTGENPRDPNDPEKPKEPLDRFLGALHHRGVKVHELAASLLSPPESRPNVLHQDLLRLFRKAEEVRLVTTNFDLHFEAAAKAVFGETSPVVYRAPALPLGRDFTGIVYVHGSLPEARSLVLTDADFGRAYLTEGWARRFLVDAFAKYTVLFVGYSHTDTAMHYLARALPPERDAGRFALTDDEDDGNWNFLGIKPVRFGKGQFDDLNESVRLLADRTRRTVLDWRSRLTELGSLLPPADEDAASELDQALREVHTTRYLLDVARAPEWLRWLNRRGHLDPLFTTSDLSETHRHLVGWVANFTVAHPNEVFDLLAARKLQMNPRLWLAVSHRLTSSKEQVSEATLQRWVSILLACQPLQDHRQELHELVVLCAGKEQVELALRVFLVLSQPQLTLKGSTRSNYSGEEDYYEPSGNCSLSVGHSSLDELWSGHLKPHLPTIAHSLLAGVTKCLEGLHNELTTWDRASSEYDPNSYRRHAIELHALDPYPEAVDVLIDAARDALESLAQRAPLRLSAWIELLISSRSPVLRRLAIHGMLEHPELSHDARLEWLLHRLGLNRLAEHHEVFRAVALNYPRASEQNRKAVVDAVLALTQPRYLHHSPEDSTAHLHFTWLAWLLQAKPDCALAEAAIAPIQLAHPEWHPSERPDFTHWMEPVEWVDSKSPCSVEQLLLRPPSEQLEDLLAFKGDSIYEPSRAGLLPNLREACKQDVAWAFGLMRALEERSNWAADLWPSLLWGLQAAELTTAQWQEVLASVSNQGLQSVHTYPIANLLHSLVKDGGKPFALELLPQADEIALTTWDRMESVQEDEAEVEDWLSHAINRSAGVIVNFWLDSISLLVRDKDGPERTMPDRYREWFTMVVEDETSKGDMGRSLIASQAAFLFHLDEAWTRQYVIPLFSERDPRSFNQAWDGFLTWGHLTPDLAEVLTPAFIAVFGRRSELKDSHHRFIDYYTSLAVYHTSDPTQQLLPALLNHGSLDDRVAFASNLGHRLRHIAATDRKRLWDTWVQRYWQGRLRGVPAALEAGEVLEMLRWLPNLGDAFPEAVELAIQSRPQAIPSSLAYALSESSFVARFPNATAELLICLTNCSGGSYAAQLAAIDARLTMISSQTRKRIDEAFARAGVTKVGDDVHRV